MIFIGYENNSYHFIYYIQENVIFYFTHVIFDEEFFSEYTDSLLKVYKLCDKLLDKISSKTELSVFNPSRKDKSALVSILPIQNNPLTCSLLSSLSYKSLSFLYTPGSEKPTVEIEEDNNVDSDIEI